MRKTVGKPSPGGAPVPGPGELDVSRSAHVFVTSEDAQHPVELAFDEHRGVGGTEWIAGGPGAQSVTVAFDSPQDVRAVALEVEDRESRRTQETSLAVSTSGGSTFETIRRQEYNFAPDGATFERQRWVIDAPGLTHVRVEIRPDKGGGAARARLTSFVIEVRGA